VHESVRALIDPHVHIHRAPRPSRRVAIAVFAVALSACASSARPVAVRTAARTASAVTVAASVTPTRCDSQMPASPPLVGSARVDMVLVPIAAVRVDVCLYRDGALASHATLLDGAAADAVENATNTLQGQDPGTPELCTPGTTSGYVVQFDDGLHTTSVGGSPTGCATVTNGFLTAAPTPPWNAMRTKLFAAAAACERQVPGRAGCVATGSW